MFVFFATAGISLLVTLVLEQTSGKVRHIVIALT